MAGNYVQGIFDNAASAYNVLINGGTQYTNKAGMYIGNDTNTAGTGKYGMNLYQDLSGGHSYLDARSLAGAAGSLNMRYMDDSTRTVSNMLVLQKDDKSLDANFGANVTGRVRASQLVVNEVDTRLPLTAGVYMGHDASTVGYFRVNKGASGNGGFNFGTYDASGVLVPGSNLSLKGNGQVMASMYTATGHADDWESVAIAGFDAEGNIVRTYNSNKRVRAIESRLTVLENDVSSNVPNKVNEIVSRLNGLNFFSNNISYLTITF